jgi:hypothetical protein
LEPIDVVLVDLPRMLSELLRTLLEPEPDIRVQRGSAALGAAPPRVLIVGVERPEDARTWCRLLEGAGRTKILTVTGGGRDAALYELRPHHTPLGELSAARLLEAVRGVRGRLQQTQSTEEPR